MCRTAGALSASIRRVFLLCSADPYFARNASTNSPIPRGESPNPGGRRVTLRRPARAFHRTSTCRHGAPGLPAQWRWLATGDRRRGRRLGPGACFVLGRTGACTPSSRPPFPWPTAGWPCAWSPPRTARTPMRVLALGHDASLPFDDVSRPAHGVLSAQRTAGRCRSSPPSLGPGRWRRGACRQRPVFAADGGRARRGRATAGRVSLGTGRARPGACRRPVPRIGVDRTTPMLAGGPGRRLDLGVEACRWPT